ncbi:MAG: Hsp20/alpha crystallin family protein [Burkholderiaceae bacterium]|nr:Hsp20/alpha crystallin family protein [Burkholderiaceae bacterium]
MDEKCPWWDHTTRRRIHRIEIPYGRFRRRIALPMHVLEPVAQELVNGCLVLTFNKMKGPR